MPLCRGSVRGERICAIKLMRRYRATGSLAPGQIGGHRRPILESERAWLMGRIAAQSDITDRALADALAVRGIVVSCVSVWNLLKRENIACDIGPSRAGSIAASKFIAIRTDIVGRLVPV